MAEKEAEREKLFSQREEELKRVLHEKEQNLEQTLREREEEMRLAIEERELQKMAALSETDTEKDRLQQRVKELLQVSVGYIHDNAEMYEVCVVKVLNAVIVLIVDVLHTSQLLSKPFKLLYGVYGAGVMNRDNCYFLTRTCFGSVAVRCVFVYSYQCILD